MLLLKVLFHKHLSYITHNTAGETYVISRLKACEYVVVSLKNYLTPVTINDGSGEGLQEFRQDIVL